MQGGGFRKGSAFLFISQMQENPGKTFQVKSWRDFRDYPGLFSRFLSGLFPGDPCKI
jgi:hypothetical protein